MTFGARFDDHRANGSAGKLRSNISASNWRKSARWWSGARSGSRLVSAGVLQPAATDAKGRDRLGGQGLLLRTVAESRAHRAKSRAAM